MKIKALKNKLLLTALCAGILGICWALQVPCLYKTFLHIPCPGCGMTRAWLSLLRGDIAGAFAFHPLFWSIPLLYAYMLFDGNLLGIKWLDRTVLIGIATGFAVNWIIQLIFVAI